MAFLAACFGVAAAAQERPTPPDPSGGDEAMPVIDPQEAKELAAGRNGVVLNVEGKLMFVPSRPPASEYLHKAKVAIERSNFPLDQFEAADHEVLLGIRRVLNDAFTQKTAWPIWSELCALHDDPHGRLRLFADAREAESDSRDAAVFARLLELSPGGSDRLAEVVERTTAVSVTLDIRELALRAPQKALSMAQAACQERNL